MNKNCVYYQILLLLLLGSVLSYGAKDIEGYSIPLDIHSATTFRNALYVATDGGIRTFIQGDVSEVYTADDGLETTQFYSVFGNQKGLFAVSSKGLIAMQANLREPFTVINRSFLSSNAEVIPGLIDIAESVMVLGFEDKIALIDLISGRSLISLTTIGSHRLSTSSVTALNIKDDSLFVAINNEVYVRKMDWINLEADLFLADPSTWKPVSIPALVPDTIRAIAWIEDSLVVRKEKGTLSYDSNRKKTEAYLNSSQLFLNGQKINDPMLSKNDSSQIEWILETDKEAYFVGPRTVIYRKDKKWKDVSAWANYSLGPVHQIQSFKTGGIFAASPYGYLAWSDGYSWTPKHLVNFTPFIFEQESIVFKMKSIALDRNGYMIYGLWGGGFLLLNESGLQIYKHISPSTSCIDNFLENYIVSIGSVTAPDQSGFLVSYWSSEQYGFAYISLEGEVSCANKIGSTPYPGPLTVRISPEDPNKWEVYSSAGNSNQVSSKGSLDVFTFTAPSKTGGRLLDVDVQTYEGPNNERIIDLDFDATGRLWLAGYSSIGYLDDDQIQLPHKISGYSGAVNSSLGVDVQGNIWVGTNQGAYRLTPKNGLPDILTAINYKMKDGLLSNEIYDLGIDSTKGMIWFGHNNGITRYTRKDLRKADSFMTKEAPKKPIAYPNPFMPKTQGKVVIDYIAEESTVQIYNAGGALVRSFTGEELLGGRLEWDGRDLSGRLVAPGLYHYFVRKEDKREKGKLIIVH